MKRAGMLFAMLALAAVAVAQQPAQPGATQPAQKPEGQQPAAQQPTDPQAAAAAAAAAKRHPKAKSQAESDAYKAAMASSDAATMEKATNDFATAYPDSALTPILSRMVMRSYQAAGNNDKVLEIGQKMIAADPDDPEALVDVAQVMTDRTRDSDIDKNERLDQAMKYAQHSLETVDTDLPPALSPEQEGIFKGLMKSNAYSVIGALHFKAGKFPEAADAFQKSIDAFPQQPDPVVVLRLALALDKQGKYPEALKAAKQAVQLTQDGTNVGIMARREQDKLTKQASGGAPAAATPKN